MSSLFGGGGGGGGSPPVAPKLKQVNWPQLEKVSSTMGNTWANLMRGSYGFQPPTPGAPGSWESQIPGFPKGTGLGEGALAEMGQAARPFEGEQDPQIQAIESKAFGKPSFQGAGGAFGGGGGGSTWNFGSNPWQTSAELGQQFSAPFKQASRNQTFLNTELGQWQPPNLTLTGEDRLNVAMGQAAQNAQAQQAAFEAQLTGATTLAQQSQMAQDALIGAGGKAVGAGINAAFTPNSYGTTPFGLLFGGGTGPVDTGVGSAYYGSAGGFDVTGPTSFTETSSGGSPGG